MRINLLIFTVATFIQCNTTFAQTEWSFKKFNKQSGKVVSLPYSLDKFWLFEKKGSWGLYSETLEKVLVPPNYDLVLPSLEKGFFYIISGQSVGIYCSVNQAELIKPEFAYLQFLQDEEGKLYIKDTETILNEGGGVNDFYSEQSDTYLLTQSPSNGIWSIGEDLLERDLKLKDEKLHKDNVFFHKDNDWIHNHTRLEIKKKEDSPGYILADVMEESGIISAFDKTYRIPSRYYAIREGSTFIEIDKVGELELDYFPPISTLKGMYTLNYRLIGDPQKGHNGGVIRGGGFYFHGSKVLKLFDQEGSLVTVINNFDNRIGGILILNDKYYVAYETSWGDTDTPGQFIYSMNGELINKLHFSFESIYEDVNTASVSVTDPLNTDEALQGILDLSNDQMLIEPRYDWIGKGDYMKTLFSCPDGGCDYYYGAYLDGNRFYFDKGGNTLNEGVELEVGGGDYQLTPLNEESAGNEQERDSSMATHEVMFGDGEAYFEARMIDTYLDLAIYETSSEDTQQINYGLANQKAGYFMMAPNFEMIEFEKNSDQVKLTYKDKEYVFPIGRYKK